MNGTTTATANAPCNCSDNSSASTVALVPNKRVDYAYGMVLGVNDFRQEQLNFEWKSHLSNLLLHGYGTVCGLKVSIVPTSDGDFELRIDPGFGISPKGHWIWVERAECARIGQWVQASTPSPVSGPRTLYVKLCYHECPTDLVPVASSACSSQDQTRAPSRITESFRASFSWEAPPEGLEDDIRLLGELLHRVEIVDGPLSPPHDGGLIERVRELAAFCTSPPASPPIHSPPVHSPPVHSPPDFGPILLDRLTACETIRHALAVWVTEVRPVVGCGCLPPRDSEDCLLLAALHFFTDANGKVTGPIEIDEHKRAIIVPTRVIQELLPCGSREAQPASSPPEAAAAAVPEYTFASLYLSSVQTQVRSFGVPIDLPIRRPPFITTTTLTMVAWIHHPTALDIPLGAVSIQVETTSTSGSTTVTIPATSISKAAELTAPGGTTVYVLTVEDNGSLISDSAMIAVRFDATSITEENASPARTLSQSLAAPGGSRAYVDYDGQYLWAYLPTGSITAGDLTGYDANPTIAKLQGNVVSAASPAAGDVLTYVAASGSTPAQWEAVAPAVSAAPITNYVQANHPPAVYAIVAAGYFKVTRSATNVITGAQPVAPAYNGLKVTAFSGTGVFTLNFDGYTPPTVAFTYIVKGTAQMTESKGNSFVFSFISFGTTAAAGLQIQVVAPVNDASAGPLEGFMVEISAFGTLPANS